MCDKSAKQNQRDQVKNIHCLINKFKKQQQHIKQGEKLFVFVERVFFVCRCIAVKRKIRTTVVTQNWTFSDVSVIF